MDPTRVQRDSISKYYSKGRGTLCSLLLKVKVRSLRVAIFLYIFDETVLIFCSTIFLILLQTTNYFPAHRHRSGLCVGCTRTREAGEVRFTADETAEASRSGSLIEEKWRVPLTED